MTNKILAYAFFACLAGPGAMHGQSAMTGQSHPELLATNNDTGSADEDAKPSPARPVADDAHAPVMPADGTLASPAIAAPPAIVTTRRIAPDTAGSRNDSDEGDYGIVTRVPHQPGELAEGTILRTHLDEAISTAYTRVGSSFSARIVREVTQDGRVIIPIGSTVRGRVTKATEKRRVQGRAKLRLRPDEIVLPDGSRLMLHAQVIDTDAISHTRTDSEGTIISEDNTRKNWEIAGATTGTGAISGAVVGGAVGAAVGTVVGAGVGASHYMMAHPVAELPQSAMLVFQLTEPMSITPLHE